MKVWKKYQSWFAALKEREKKIVALAILLGGLFLGYTYGIEPNLLAAKRAAKSQAEASLSAATLSQQTALFAGANTDPDAPLRARRDKLKAELAGQDERFSRVRTGLVPADKMSQLLQTYLARGNSLQLVSLRTLPPTPVIPRKPAGEGKDKPLPAVGEQAANAAATLAAAPNLYKHGVEIRLSGRYADLLAYVSALEATPQRLLWGDMNLEAQEYPHSQLTLTVYTLSLDKSWLTL